MLTRVDITNYRGFKSYHMEGLAQVNLFVGKNNSGKTALLEGIQFLTSGGDIGVLGQAAERRGEVVLATVERNGSQPVRQLRFELAHFFHGHQLAINASFTLEGDGGVSPITTTVLEFNNRVNGSQTQDMLNARQIAMVIRAGKEGESKSSMYSMTRDGSVALDNAGLVGEEIWMPGGFEPLGRTRNKTARFVGTDSLDTLSLAVMRDELVLEGKEREVDAALRILEPNVESVQMLAGILNHALYGSKAGAVVGLKGKQGRVPLGSMGDGMRRLLALSTALVSTQGGSLFVDEIDTGLHYSIMADMWKLVVTKAIRSNIQIFATTHSWDCIEGLATLCQREPEFLSNVAVHTIDPAIPHSIPFTGESLVRMVRNDIDPR